MYSLTTMHFVRQTDGQTKDIMPIAEYDRLKIRGDGVESVPVFITCRL